MTRRQGPVFRPSQLEERKDDVPSLFATIHFRSEERPEGYTAEEIEEINEALNQSSD